MWDWRGDGEQLWEAVLEAGRVRAPEMHGESALEQTRTLKTGSDQASGRSPGGKSNLHVVEQALNWIWTS